MEKFITDERTGLCYELVGDYYLIAGEDEPEGRPIGIWGQRNLRYIRKHKVSLYAERLTTGKLNDYEVRVLINGLMQQHRSYDAETNGQIDALALRLCDIAEAMKPGRKKKIPFEPVEIRVIRHCLIEWRNREIQAERHGAVDALNELLIWFTR